LEERTRGNFFLRELLTQVEPMGSSPAISKTLTTCSLGSQLSAGMNHQLKIAKMVMAPRITPAYHGEPGRDTGQINVTTGKQLCPEGLTKLNVSAVTGKKKGETSTANTIALKNPAAT
jgi:hypothetical protein